MDPTKVSGRQVRRVSREDIQLVQNLIERCLQLYMNQKEVVDKLLLEAKIEPGFTELVWQKLEEENREFFKAYNLRLRVKEQILEFNRLMLQQKQLMQQLGLAGIGSNSISNGSQASSLQAPPYVPKVHGGTTAPSQILHGSPSSFLNGRSTLQQSVPVNDDICVRTGQLDISHNMLAVQSAPFDMLSGGNGSEMTIKHEHEYPETSFHFAADNQLNGAAHIGIGDASAVHFGDIDSLSNDALESEQSLYAPHLLRIPRGVSFSDLTSIGQAFDMMQRYDGCPYLGTESENFLEHSQQGVHRHHLS